MLSASSLLLLKQTIALMGTRRMMKKNNHHSFGVGMRRLAFLVWTSTTTPTICSASSSYVDRRSLAFLHHVHKRRSERKVTTRAFSTAEADSRIVDMMSGDDVNGGGGDWEDVLPLEKGSHDSARITIPSVQDQDSDDPFEKALFRDRLEATVTACRELGRTSLWIEVPMSRARLIEDMVEFGLQFHHAEGDKAVLNVWLKDDSESKIPSFATHHVGVGGVVVNSRDEILCVRELRRNYMPWKTPTGLSELGEQIDQAVQREVFEETGIRTVFHSILGFRQTHGLAHGRSDLFFVCRLDPVEEVDDEGNVIIPEPVAQESEIEKAAWVPLSEYRDMVIGGKSGEAGHPLMQHILGVFDAGRKIERTTVSSVVPGRKPNAIYYPTQTKDDK